MWTTYRVRWEFISQLCASVPGNSDLIAKWLAARAPTARPPQSKSLEEIASEVIETLAAGDESAPPEIATLVFQRVNGVLAVRLATIKAHLKDCAYQLQTYVAGYVQGEKALRTKVANAVYWPATDPVIMFHGTPFIPILDRNGKPFSTPNGVRVRADGEEDGVGPREKAIHVRTPQGERSALKAFEFCEDAILEFPLSILTAPSRIVKRGKDLVTIPGRPVIDEDDLKSIMLYGGMHGYAGERSEDGGRYAFTITKGGA
jgi:hypothetical protein